MVKIVVGHGTPNIGSRGKTCPSARAIAGYNSAYAIRPQERTYWKKGPREAWNRC
jgi:hypothetical protein